MLHYLSLFCLLLLSTYATAQQTRQEPYEFPVKPGTEEWKEFSSGKEMIDACQVPENVLQSMNTAALVQTCLNYPLIGHIYAYNDLQTGAKAVIAEFNGFKELLQRPDAGAEIMKLYGKMKPVDLKKEWSLLEKGEFAFKFATIELLLAQQPVINNLSKEQKKALVAESLQKFKEKDVLIETFGATGLITSALIMGRVLEKDNFIPSGSASAAQTSAAGSGTTSEAVQAFLRRAEVVDANVIINMVVDAQAYLKQ